eukprot:Gb_09561 [translate_table: standard]
MLVIVGVERTCEGLDGVHNSFENGVMGKPTKGSSQKADLKFLIYGKIGWIGGLLGQICEKQGIAYEHESGRLENSWQLQMDTEEANPTDVFNAVGVTSRPNVDWCESHKPETICTNVMGTLNLANVCQNYGLLLVNFAISRIF